MPPSDGTLDETRAYIHELGRRAAGEPPRPVSAPAPTGTAARVRELWGLSAGVTDDRAGLAGTLGRLLRRGRWLARDAHGRAHLETVAVVDELERRLADVERRLDEVESRLGDPR